MVKYLWHEKIFGLIASSSVFISVGTKKSRVRSLV